MFWLTAALVRLRRRVLNISSMRSVTTKPPTTFAVARTIARKQTIFMNTPGWCCPVTMIAPTITMPWIAFVPDISGVCSSVGTFEITSKPRKIASIRIVSSRDELRAHAGPPPPACRRRRLRR